MKRQYFIGFLLLLGATAARSQSTSFKPDFEITLLGGYQFGGAVDETYKVHGVDFHGESLGLNGSEVVGVAFDYRLGPKLLLEFSLDRQNTKLKYSDETNTGFQDLSDIKVGHYQAGLIYHWGAGSVQTYTGGTLGVTSLEPSAGLSSEVRFAAAPVFGIKTFSSKHFGFRFQTRLMVTNMPSGEYSPIRPRNRAIITF